MTGETLFWKRNGGAPPALGRHANPDPDRPCPLRARRFARQCRHPSSYGTVDLVAGNPEAGDVMQGTGGVRKARLAGRGKGKSGGYRIVFISAAGTSRCSC